MPDQFNFKVYYKTINNIELLTILENPQDYQKEAIESAKEEFLDRNLSINEIGEARAIINDAKEEKEFEREKINKIESKFNAVGSNFFNTISPIQNGISSVEKSKRMIVLIFGGVYIYRLIKNRSLYLANIMDIPKFPVGSLFSLLPDIILPVAIVLFWKRKPIGWQLLAIFVCFCGTSAIWLLFRSFFYKKYELVGYVNLFQEPSPMTYLIQILFFLGTLYALCLPNLRAIYSIGKQKMQRTITMTIIVTMLILITFQY